MERDSNDIDRLITGLNATAPAYPTASARRDTARLDGWLGILADRAGSDLLLVAGAPFVTVGGTLPIVRETEAPRNPQVVEMIASAARAEAAHEKVGAGS